MLKKFISLSDLLHKTGVVLSRFPFVITCFLVATITALWLAELDHAGQTDPGFWTHLLFVTILGAPLLLSVSTYAESRPEEERKKLTLTLNVSVLLLMVVTYLLLPENFDVSESESFIRYMLYVLAATLMVSFLPWLQNGATNEFWAYNKSLFINLLFSGLYSGVLFVGLSLALLSLENLLGLQIEDHRYFQLWIVMALFVTPGFFLSGVPHPSHLTEEEKMYPAGLKVFVQNILIPLVTIYIAILYLYTGKILFQWEWPNGWVANLVLGYSIAGILALLLLYPISREAANRWVQLFSKSYYMALIPLIVLLALSIWVRISEYGVTVNRFFVATLAVWLTAMVIYFLVTRNHERPNIKVIPVSLCLLMLAISIGPFSAFNVSKRSQHDRLEQILDSHDLLSEQGRYIQTAGGADDLSLEDQAQISSIVTYLVTLGAMDVLQPWFEADLSELTYEGDPVTDGSYQHAEAVVSEMGITYRLPSPSLDGELTRFNLTSAPNELIELDGYSYSTGDLYFYREDSDWNLREGELAIQIRYDFDRNVLTVSRTDLPDSAVDTQIELAMEPFLRERILEYRNSRIESFELPVQDLTLQAENPQINVKVIVTSINGQLDDSLDVGRISLVCLITVSGG